jgi:ubiquinone/menaquinone biosynthesis C-methylase UbiE
MRRVVAAETLDRLPPDDPDALRSRRDLVRVHLAMGTRGIVRRAWQAMFTARATRAPLRILELGAGDGSLLLGVARSLAPRWPAVQLTLLDQQDIVSPATRRASRRWAGLPA